MSFNYDGYEVVSIELFRLKTPFVTIGRSVRLSRKAFEILGNPRFVILDFNQFKRTLSIRKYELEEGQIRPLEPTRSSAALAVGTVDDSRYIIGISEFRRMLREQFKNDYRLRLPGRSVRTVWYSNWTMRFSLSALNADTALPFLEMV